MEKRSDRYNESSEVPQTKQTRTARNRLLYDEVNSKIGIEEIPTYETPKEIDLSSLDMNNLNRGDYQQVKDFKNLIENSSKEEEKPQEEVNKKNYDINKVLEEAKKNRKADELEEKRNIKEEDYNVLKNLNKKYLHRKGFTEEDNEELKELIDTITSKTLVDDIKDDEEKELLSELLATTIDIKLESELSDEQIQELADENTSTEEYTDTNSFYSKSLELSKEDMVDEGKDETEEIGEINEEDEEIENHNIAKIIFFTIILLIIVVIVSYFILQFFGIKFN